MTTIYIYPRDPRNVDFKIDPKANWMFACTSVDQMTKMLYHHRCDPKRVLQVDDGVWDSCKVVDFTSALQAYFDRMCGNR